MKRNPTWSQSGADPNPFVSLPSKKARDSPLTPPKLLQEHRVGSPFLTTASRSEVERRQQRQQIIALSIELERLTSQLAAERIKSEQVSRAKDARILDLERDRQVLYDNERRTKEEMERVVNQLKREQVELGRQLGTIQAQAEQLKMELQGVHSEKRALDRKVSTLEADLHSARGQADARLRTLKEELDRRSEIISKQEVLLGELRHHGREEGERASSEGTQGLSIEMPSLGELLERIHHLEATNRRLQTERKTLLEAAQSARILTERLHTADVRLGQYQQRLELQNLTSSTPVSAGPPIGDTLAAGITNIDNNRQVRQLIERTAELAKAQEALGEAEAERKHLKVEMEGLIDQVARLEKTIKDLQVENANIREQHLGCSSHEGLLRSELAILKERLEAAERTELATRNILMKIKTHPTAMEG